jgi:hypothetical protein
MTELAWSKEAHSIRASDGVPLGVTSMLASRIADEGCGTSSFARVQLRPGWGLARRPSTSPRPHARPRGAASRHRAHIIEAPWVSTPATVTGRWRARRLNDVSWYAWTGGARTVAGDAGVDEPAGCCCAAAAGGGAISMDSSTPGLLRAGGAAAAAAAGSRGVGCWAGPPPLGGAHHHQLIEAPWTPAPLPVAGQWRARRPNHHTHLCRTAAATSTETSTSIDTSGLAALSTWADELFILGPAVWAQRGSLSCGPVAAPSAGCDEVFKDPPDSVRRFSCVRFGRLVERRGGCEHTVRVRVKIMRSQKCRIAGKSQSGLIRSRTDREMWWGAGRGGREGGSAPPVVRGGAARESGRSGHDPAPGGQTTP